MKNEFKVKIGKGELLIPDSILKDNRNSWILLQVIQKKGPCKDEFCQLIEEVDVKISSDPLEGMILIDNTFNINIATDKTFNESVDRGRKIIRLYKSLNGKIKTKGF